MIFGEGFARVRGVVSGLFRWTNMKPFVGGDGFLGII
jgi:hypothetical protein